MSQVATMAMPARCIVAVKPSMSVNSEVTSRRSPLSLIRHHASRVEIRRGPPEGHSAAFPRARRAPYKSTQREKVGIGWFSPLSPFALPPAGSVLSIWISGLGGRSLPEILSRQSPMLFMRSRPRWRRMGKNGVGAECVGGLTRDVRTSAPRHCQLNRTAKACSARPAETG